MKTILVARSDGEVREVKAGDLVALAQACKPRADGHDPKITCHFDLPYRQHNGRMFAARAQVTYESKCGFDIVVEPLETDNEFHGHVQDEECGGVLRWDVKVHLDTTKPRQHWTLRRDGKKRTGGEVPAWVQCLAEVFRRAVKWLAENSEVHRIDTANEETYWRVNFDRFEIYEARVFRYLLERRRESDPRRDFGTFDDDLRWNTLMSIGRNVRGHRDCPHGYEHAPFLMGRKPVQQADGRWGWRLECEYDDEDFVYETRDEPTALAAAETVIKAARLPAYRTLLHELNRRPDGCFRYCSPHGMDNISQVGAMGGFMSRYAWFHDTWSRDERFDNRLPDGVYDDGCINLLVEHMFNEKGDRTYGWWAEHDRANGEHLHCRGRERNLPEAVHAGMMWLSLMHNKILLEDHGERGWARHWNHNHPKVPA